MSYPPPPLAPLGAPLSTHQRSPIIRPSGWWYVAAFGVAVLGVVLGGYALRQGWLDAETASRDGTATALGEEQTITIPRPVSTTVAYVGLRLTDQAEDRTELMADLQVRIVDAGSGQEVPLGTYDGYRPLHWDDQGREVEYLPLYTVRFDQPGDYVISTRTVPGANLDESSVIVSESSFRRLRDGARRAAAFTVGGILGFILLAMIIGRTRGRAKRAWAAANPPVPWQPPAQTWGGPQPPPSWGGPPRWG